jgi:hypothetical protein
LEMARGNREIPLTLSEIIAASQWLAGNDGGSQTRRAVGSRLF